METQIQTLNLHDVLQNYSSNFSKELDQSLVQLKTRFNSTNQKLWDSISYSVLNGGKRLRPILALLTFEALQKSPEPIPLSQNPATAIALAIEFVHSGSLIHDDLPCMDNDDLRRGKPSTHKAFNEATALLAGDFLLAYPAQVFAEKITDYNIDHKTQTLCLHKLQTAINDMILGQVMDMNLTKQAGETELREMEKLKTGALLKASIEIPALLANATETQIQTLSTYANNLGLAFQITDDVLDATASTKELGKTAGKDHEQSKLTFVREYGLQQSRKIAKDLIDEAKEAISSGTAGLYADKLNLVADYVISRSH